MHFVRFITYHLVTKTFLFLNLVHNSLTTRVNCHTKPLSKCDNTRRVPKKSFIAELLTTVFSKNAEMKVSLFVTELGK